MSNIRLQGNPSGTGTLTIASPNTNSDFTLNLPTANGTIPLLATVTNNGVMFINGSGQPTTGGALTFDGAGVLTVGNDSVATVFNAPGDVVQYVVDSNGTGSSASHQWRYGSTEAMRLTSTGLGIGTSSPAYKLNVSGSGYIFGLNGGGTSRVAQTFGNTGGNLDIGIESSGGGTLFTGGSAYASCIGSGNATPLQFGTNGTIRATLDTFGNLGLGVTPSAWRSGTPAFQIGSAGFCAFADSGITAELGNNVFLNSSSQYIYLRTDAASRYRQYQGVHSWLTAGSGTAGTAIGFSTVMTLDASGNLGIGTSSPSFPLDVAGAARSNSWIARANTSAPTADAFIYRPADNTLGFGTANTERARITSAGNFGVGTTAPAYRCVVQDSAGETIFGINNTSSGGRHYLLISGGSGGSYAGGRFGLYSVTNNIDLFAATTSTASTAGGTTGNGAGFANAGLWFDRGWGDYPSISVCSNNYAGNTNQSQLRIHGTNTTWYTYPSASGSDFSCSLFIDGTYQTGSDRRFKTNITEIDNALEKVLSMTGKRFQTVNRIGEVETNASQNGFRFGFIAQDLQAAGLDELYKHNVDEDDGTDGFNKAYCVEYDAVAPLLVNAIKEQQDIITALTARIAALEAK